MKQEI